MIRFKTGSGSGMTANALIDAEAMDFADATLVYLANRVSYFSSQNGPLSA